MNNNSKFKLINENYKRNKDDVNNINKIFIHNILRKVERSFIYLIQMNSLKKFSVMS